MRPDTWCAARALRRPGSVMVCTDAAARGIDIPAVTHVLQASFAAGAVDFLHRCAPLRSVQRPACMRMQGQMSCCSMWRLMEDRCSLHTVLLTVRIMQRSAA